MRQTFVPHFFNILHARILSRGKANRCKNGAKSLLWRRAIPAKTALSRSLGQPPADQWQRGILVAHGQMRKESGQQNQPHTDKRTNFWKTQWLSYARVAQEGILPEQEGTGQPLRDSPLVCWGTHRCPPDVPRTGPRTGHGRQTDTPFSLIRTLRTLLPNS